MAGDPKRGGAGLGELPVESARHRGKRERRGGGAEESRRETRGPVGNAEGGIVGEAREGLAGLWGQVARLRTPGGVMGPLGRVKGEKWWVWDEAPLFRWERSFFGFPKENEQVGGSGRRP